MKDRRENWQTRSLAPSDENPRRRVRARRRYHLGTPGAIYVFLTLLVALGAFNSQNNLLFWAFGFALALLVVSGLISGAMLMGLDVRRLPIGESTVNERMPIHYRLSNRNRRMPAFALTITEVAPAPRRARRTASATWPSFTSEPSAFVAHVGPGQTVHGEAVTLPTRRGIPRFTHILISTAFPFGIIKKSLLFEQTTDAIVRPAPLPVAASILQRATRQGSHGAAPTRRAGPGDEFFALREYVPGDSPRAIAWRASARGQDLLVRQSAAPAPVRVWAVLRFTPGATEQMNERAIGLVAGLIDTATTRGLDVGLSVPLMDVAISPRDGRLQRERLMNELAVLDLGALEGLRRLARPNVDAPPGVRGRVVCAVVHSGALEQDEGIEGPGSVHLSALDAAEFAPHSESGPGAPRARQLTAIGPRRSTVGAGSPRP